MPEMGGEHVMHPAKTDMMRFFDLIDGPDFGTVRARALTKEVELGSYLPLVRTRRSLRGFLSENVYGVRAAVVLRAEVLPARSLKQLIGAPEDAQVVLLLFDGDPVIERLFHDARTLIPSLLDAGYDLVVAPSYSCWWPRPRSDHIFNLKRSLWVFGVLQAQGVPAIPRVAWATSGDAFRFAEWVMENPSVTTVGVDLMTYRADRWWRGQIEGLQAFDQATGQRVRYLINGPSDFNRFVDIYCAVDSERVTMTNLAIARPPRDLRPKAPLGARFTQEIDHDRQALHDATRAAKGGLSDRAA